MLKVKKLGPDLADKRRIAERLVLKHVEREPCHCVKKAIANRFGEFPLVVEGQPHRGQT